MDLHELPYRLKSARQKKRLVKKDRDKRLIQLDKLTVELLLKKRNLPMRPLEQPYQKGWKRLFVLRKDLVQNVKAEFYKGILKKINNIKYHYDESFKVKKKRRWLHSYLEIPQTLRELTEREWQTNSLKLTDDERQCFYPKQEWDNSRRCMVTKYAFIETWRFVLTVMPHIIYEAKMHDQLLEQELQEATDRFNSYDSWPRIHRLTSGRSYRYWSVKYFDKPKYINKFKNKPLYIIQDEYTD